MVEVKMAKLKKDKGTGPDGIHVNILKEGTALSLPLSILFNDSIRQSQLPQDWKDGHICPIHKKGSRRVCKNYRPVSLTSQVVKLLERLQLDAILAHMKKNDIVSCDQHGFQSGCSCVTQLLECLWDWTENWDQKLPTDVVYLDFSKAFDTVPHERLIHKLSWYGIKGQMLQWVKGRRQRE